MSRSLIECATCAEIAVNGGKDQTDRLLLFAFLSAINVQCANVVKVTHMVEAPIFIVGTGRSGTTIFHRILSKHPSVAWLSRLCVKYPGRPWLNRWLMRGLSVPLVRGVLSMRWSPSEAYAFWEFNCPGFDNPYRDLLAEDVTPTSAARIQSAISQMMTRTRYRLLVKITGWPRILYLREIFPDARVINVTRDPCAVASSFLEVPWWDGWRGPTSWRHGPLPPDLDAIWREQGQSFVALAALECVIFERTMQHCRQSLPAGQILDVTYTRLCADPVGTFRSVVEHCKLDWSNQFEKVIMRVSLRNNDDKWRKYLTPRQQDVLVHTLERAQSSRLG
jgi:hypothetical protein